MKRKLLVLCAASLVGAGVLNAADGNLLAEDATGATFDAYSADDATYAVMSSAEIAALPSVTWRVDETVTATKWNGDTTTLVTSAVSNGSGAFVPDAGGIWTLVNSKQGTARICVPWTVYGDSMSMTSGASPGFAADSKLPGPDRVTKPRDALPIAYTGDNWVGDRSKSATLTLVSPSGAETTLDRTGTGTETFAFGALGNWGVRLAMADGTTLEASIALFDGFSIIIR